MVKNENKNWLVVLIVALSIFVTSVATADEEVVEVSPSVGKPASKDLQMTLDTQWINGVRTIETPAVRASSLLMRMHLGSSYRFSDLTELFIKLPIVMHQYEEKYRFLGGGTMAYRNTEWYTDRLRAGIEGKLFLDTFLGRVSWFATGFLPTMSGFKTAEYNFYNHTAVKVGLKNLAFFGDNRLSMVGSAGYTFKFEKSYQIETRDYGDEIGGSLGVGYLVTEHISPLVQAQYSYVFPLERIMGSFTRSTPHGASQVHIAPSLSFPIHNDFSLNVDSRILAYRSKINNREANFMWGNFEDEGEVSVQLGIRLGVL